MKKAILFFLISCIPILICGQGFKIKMDGLYDDKGAGVMQLSNGNIIYFGSTSVSAANNNFDLFFTCFTPAGLLSWSKQIPLAGSQTAFTIEQGANNCIFLLARDVATESILLIKIDANGQILWSKSYSMAGNNSANPLSLKEASDGTLIFLCTFYSSVKGYVFKTDASGNLLWSKYFNPINQGQGYMRSVEILSDGNYLISGYADTDLGSSCLIKMDPSGNVMWQKSNTSPYVFEIFQAQCEMNNGDIITGGYVYNNNRSMMIFKYDALGNIIWSKTYYTPNRNLLIMTMAKSASQDIIISGVYYQSPYSENTSQNFVCKISSATGAIIWAKLLNQTNDGEMVQSASTLAIAADGGLLCAGTVFNGVNGSYAQLIKTDSAGLGLSCPLTTLNTQPVTVNYSSAITNSFTNVSPVVASLNLQTVDATFCVTDICNSTAQQLGVTLGPDTNICGPINVTLSPNLSSSYSYLWNTNAQTASITVNSPGLYWVTVTDLCGNTGKDSIYISSTNLTNADIIRDTTICDGVSFTVDLTSDFQQVLWGDGSTDLIRPIVASGTYTIIATLGQCGIQDTMTVTHNFPPNAIQLPPDTMLCEGEFLPLSVTTLPSNNILWNTASTANQIIANLPGVYWVSVSNSCGNVSDSISVSVAQIVLNIAEKDTICSGSTIQIDLSAFAGNILWNDGFTGPIYQISQEGIYGVTVSQGQCEISDTIMVYESILPDISLGPDHVMCSGEQIVLTPIYTDTLSVITWASGNFPLPSVTINSGGTYWVTQTNACGSISDSLFVNEIIVSPIEILGSPWLCENELVTLYHTGSNIDAYWPNGSHASTYTVNTPGYVLLTNEVNGCKAFDSILVEDLPKPNIELGTDGIVCTGDKVLLNSNLPSGYPFSWSWSTGAGSQTAIDVTSSGTYWIEVLYCDNLITDTINLEVLQTDNTLMVPNVFTPNGDNLNEEFIITGDVVNIIQFSIEIFNRWGAKIYSSENILDSWDGKFQRKDVVDGVYVYVLTYKNTCGQEYTKHGHVTVFR